MEGSTELPDMHEKSLWTNRAQCGTLMSKSYSSSKTSEGQASSALDELHSCYGRGIAFALLSCCASYFTALCLSCSICENEQANKGKTLCKAFKASSMQSLCT